MLNKVEMYSEMSWTRFFMSHVGHRSRSDCLEGVVTGEKPTKLDGGDGEKLGGGAPSVSFLTSATFFPKNNMKSLAQKSVLSDLRV